MSSIPTVMKFGGTSLEDGLAFKRVARIVLSYKDSSPVVVASAMSRVTDALLMSAQMAADGAIAPAVRSIDEQLERHLEVAAGLEAEQRAELSFLIRERGRRIVGLLESIHADQSAAASVRDELASYGERLSARLLTAMLQAQGLPASYVDARRFILTNGDHGEAKPLLKETALRTRAELGPILEARRIPVLGGFIAANKKGATTTFGRGSSDYTATLVSAALGARETQIWTDVDGIMTGDPRLIESARLVPFLSYAEAAELSRFGAKVIHLKSIRPAADQNIPLRVCNSRSPETPGTLISNLATNSDSNRRFKAVTHKTNMAMIRISCAQTFMANGFQHAIEEIFRRHLTAVDIVATSRMGASLACEETRALATIVAELQQVGSVTVAGNRAIVCCVGDGCLNRPQTARNTLHSLKSFAPRANWHPASNISLITDVPQETSQALILKLHRRIFEDLHGADKTSERGWVATRAGF